MKIFPSILTKRIRIPSSGFLPIYSYIHHDLHPKQIYCETVKSSGIEMSKYSIV